MSELLQRLAELPPDQRALLERKLVQQGARFNIFPASFTQRRLWFLDQYEPGSPAYHLAAALSLAGQLDLRALQHSLDNVIARHEALRTRFLWLDGQPVQQVYPPVAWPLAMVDLTAQADAAQVATRAQEFARQPFDLARGPLLRAKVLRLADDQHVLLLAFHHIVMDGWSLGVLVREVATSYNAACHGQHADLAALPIQYVDYVAWQREQLQGATLARLLDYWRTQLADVPPLVLPVDFPRTAQSARAGARHTLTLPPSLATQLEHLSQQAGVTLFMTLLTALQVLLARHSNQQDFAIGTPIAQRTQVESEGLIGYLANTLVLRTDLAGDPTFWELLKRTRTMCLDAYAHQDLPFEYLVEQLQPERSLSQNPLFQVLFVLQTAPLPKLELADLAVELRELETGTAKFDLMLDLSPSSVGGLHGYVEYATALFAADTIARMAEHLTVLLQGIVANPHERVSALPLLAAAERQQLLDTWNATQASFPPEDCMQTLFEAQAARTPTAIAVVYAQQQLSYAELDARANALAQRLRALGVRPEQRVGVCLKRAPELVVALLGVLKAGGAYVPLDPAYPRERLHFMLADSGASVLLTEQVLYASYFASVDERDQRTVVLIDQEWPQPAAQRTTPSIALQPANLAYIIYTSGSTGQPKGVAITHRNAVVFIHWARSVFGTNALAGMLAATAVSFDLSIFELFVPLSWGGVVILAENVLQPMPAQPAVTLVNTVPSAMAEMLRLDLLPTSVHTINLAGEPLSPHLVAQLYAREHIQRVYNLYGPSEDTTYSTYALQTRAHAQHFATIGRPISNTQAYVLDDRMQPAPIGVIGELYLGGEGLARGYLGRPALTAERFVPNPFNDTPETRLYRTGDLVRYGLDGTLEFLGRRDHQVKLRGFRIELGEIEAVLARHPAVHELVVLVREDAPGNKQLVAYIVPTTVSQRGLVATLRAHLHETLPDYMVPSAYVLLAELPHTPNGKIDRRALPMPEQASSDDVDVSDFTPDQALMARIWAEVLSKPHIGRDENFFELGGHSLLATQVIAQVRAAFSVELPLRSLFEFPTIATLAEAVAVQRSQVAGLIAPPLRPAPRTDTMPLSFAQQRLWLLAQLDPTSVAYHVPLLLHLHGSLDVAALAHSLDALIVRHETLRTTFAVRDGQPVQQIQAATPLPLPRIDLATLPPAEREAQIQAQIATLTHQPFDLARGPLLRACVLRLADEHHMLVLTLHHIVVDGWSLGVLVREVNAVYNAVVQGQAAQLPALLAHYADYAVWQRQWLRGAVLARLLDYWRERLRNAPQLAMPTDRPRRATPTLHLGEQPAHLSKPLSDAIAAYSRSAGATVFMTLLAALDVLLHMYTRQEDIVVGADIANRTHAETEPLIGFFVNMLALRVDVSGNPSFRQLVERVRSVCLGAYAHQDLSIELLINELQPARSVQRAPLFQVVLVLQNTPLPTLELANVRAQPIVIDPGAAKFDLVLEFTETRTGMTGIIKYDADLFDALTITRLVERFVAVLTLAMQQPETSLQTVIQQIQEAERQAQTNQARELRAVQQRKSKAIRRKALSDQQEKGS